MDLQSLLPDTPSHHELNVHLGRIRQKSAMLDAAARLVGMIVQGMQADIAAFEYERSRLFANWLGDNDRSWCGMCERAWPAQQTALHLISIFDTTDEGYRSSLIHKEIADVCESCQAERRKHPRIGTHHFPGSRFNGPLEHDLTPVCAGPGAGRWNVLLQDGWTPLGAVPPTRFVPEFVPNEYAEAARLPLGIKLWEPKREEHYIVSRGSHPGGSSFHFDAK